MNVIDLKGFVLRAPWHEWAIDIGAAVVAHIIYKGAGLEPVSRSADPITFENLELGL